ncbi:MAG TPA: RIP metalloprotease RseP [Chloroflexia bacterium]|jgi:regulator of sigma E protease|nr:RIP metalloprotease RseP [Chloroflexia bacterium]
MDFGWLWVVPVLGVLIVVHELGHFLTAIWLGIKVEEFGIGFPPRAFAIRRNGIDYSLNWLPIGGFVKITGENGDSDDPRSFGKAPAWKRIIVLAAGSTMNLLLAILIFTGTSVAGTQQVDAPFTAVGGVIEKSAAEKGGMQPGDLIVAVNGQPITNDSELRTASRANLGKATKYTVERNGQRVDLTVTPQGDPPLGISLGYPISPVRVVEVRPDSVAAQAGLQPGDLIVEVNGTKATIDAQVSYMLETTRLKKISPTVVVERNGQRVGPLTLNVGDGAQPRQFGFTVHRPLTTVYYTPTEALGRALSNTWDVVTSIPRGIAQAFAGTSAGPGVTGVVGISQLTGEVAQETGINGLLTLTALLGISLFMINLMPLPALDGGRLLFILIELLRGGRRIAPEKEALVHFAGMVVLLALMALITFFDVQRLLNGQALMP